MKNQCKNCNSSFVITEDDLAFYQKMSVPAPVLCPECRFKRRCLFRNEMTLYNRKCDLCEKPIVTMYNPKSSYTVYCHSCWDSDKWDPYSYQKEYNEDRSFFEQLGELIEKVPKKATYTSSTLGPNINSDYTNVAGANKNCYLVFNSGINEDCMYCRGLMNCREALDTYYGENIESSYEVINGQQISGIMFGHNISGSLDCMFGLNLSGCQNCFGCVNLRNKNHHFFNEQLSKEEYERRVNEIKGSYSKTEEAKKKFEEFSLKFPRRENNNLKTVNVTGDYLSESKNLEDCFEALKCEDCKYGFSVKVSKDCYDFLGYGYDSELLLECVGVGNSSKIIGSYWVEGQAQNIWYSFATRSSKYCFGCDGLKSAEFCILNKKYSEDEYQQLKDKIVAELKKNDSLGLFMPPSIAPFAYNETVGQDNLPLTKEEALAQGFRWEDDIQMTTGKESIKSEEIPDHIKDVQDSILEEILACVTCQRNYRITPAELQFYRKMTLPIPRKCFYCRHADRVKKRGPMKIYNRECDNCKKSINTTFSPDRPEIVYCETCYQKEVI